MTLKLNEKYLSDFVENGDIQKIRPEILTSAETLRSSASVPIFPSGKPRWSD